MKTKLTRLLVLLCALCMVLTAFSACATGDGPKKEQGTTAGTTGDDDVVDTGDEGVGGGDTDDGTVVTPPTHVDTAPVIEDYEQYVFRMVVDSGENVNHWGPSDPDEPSEEVMDIAFWKRNDYIQNAMNIEIKVTNAPSALSGLVSTYNTSSEHYADVILASSSLMSTTVSNGYSLDLNNVNNLYLEDSYWDQRIQQDYQLEGMLFALEGDYNCWDELRTQVVLYNYDLYDSFGYVSTYGSPYQMVEKGKWTLDTMMKMFKDRSDIGNGQALTNTSKWGLLSETTFPYVVFLGTGVKTIATDRKGNVSLALSDETLYQTVFETLTGVLTPLSTSKEILFANSSNGVLTSGDVWTEVSDMFKSNLALFRTTTLSAATRLDDMEATFGILPVPKYSEKQEAYYSWCSVSDPMQIPTTVLSSTEGDIERTSKLMHAICYHSRYMPNEVDTLLDAFYENMTIVKLCRKQEDYDMMELAFANKVFDFDYHFKITGLESICASIATSGNVGVLGSSLNDSSIDTANQKLSKLLERALTKVPNPEPVG